MKLCFSSTFGYSLFRNDVTRLHGGAELDLYYIAKAMQKFPDVQVCFAVGDFGQPAIEEYDGIQVLKTFSVQRTGWKKYLYAVLIGIPKFFIALRMSRADIFIQEGASIETALVALYCMLSRKKFVYRVASTIECDGKFSRRFPMIGKLFKFGLNRAARIITEDQEEVDMLQSNFGLQATAIYDTTPIPPRDHIVPASERAYVLWVGRLVRMKHPEMFLALVRSLPQEHFVLVGLPVEQERTLYEQLVAEAQELPNLQIVSGVPHDKMDEYYRKAKLLVNTSEYEGYPNTFIEAGKYMVPVLSLNIDPDSMFAQYGVGETAQGSHEKLQVLLKSWLENESQRQRAGEVFRTYVEEKNDMQKNVHAYRAEFSKLLTTTPNFSI